MQPDKSCANCKGGPDLSKGVIWSCAFGHAKLRSPDDLNPCHDWTLAEPFSKESDPNGLKPGEPGAKLDEGKLLVWVMISGFPRALEKVAEVSTKGAEKYSVDGWAQVKDGANRYMNAFGRHELSLAQGQTHDAALGVMTKAQMVWNLLASLELELRAEEKK